MAPTAILYLFLSDLYFPLAPWQIGLYKTRFDWATRSSKQNAPNLCCLLNFFFFVVGCISKGCVTHLREIKTKQRELSLAGRGEWERAGWTIVIGAHTTSPKLTALSALKAAKLTPPSITRQRDTSRRNSHPVTETRRTEEQPGGECVDSRSLYSQPAWLNAGEWRCLDGTAGKLTRVGRCGSDPRTLITEDTIVYFCPYYHWNVYLFCNNGAVILLLIRVCSECYTVTMMSSP